MDDFDPVHTLFGIDTAVVIQRIEELEARVAAVEARREVRTHAQVTEREDRIVEALRGQTFPLNAQQIARLVEVDAKLVDSSCRKLARANRIVRDKACGRTPHYVAA